MSVLVVGSVAFDSVTTPFGSHDRILGGSATYFSLSASYFTPVRLVAVVGEDFGDEERTVFNTNDIDTTGLQTLEGGKTFHWSGAYEGDMNEAITRETHLNVLAEFKPQIPADYTDTPYVFLANIDPNLQMEVMEQVKEPKMVACDTMNFWINGMPNELEKVLRKVDLIVINDGEAKLLSGKDNLALAAKELAKLGPRYIVIKRGEYGALLFSDHGFFWAPAYPLEQVHDPTGAGDTFAGGLMGYIASQDSVDEGTIRRGMYYGGVMASHVVEEFSVKGLTGLDKTRIDKRYQAFVRLTSFE